MRLATYLPISQYQSSGNINSRISGFTEGVSTNPAECGRTQDKVWQIFSSTPPTTPPAHAEAKAEVCWSTVDDLFLGPLEPCNILITDFARLQQWKFPEMVGLFPLCNGLAGGNSATMSLVQTRRLYPCNETAISLRLGLQWW